jgi:enamine deaminase RidA (YjgF/YER057c/UK114 family)
MNADARFALEAQNLGYNFDGEIKVGGAYAPLIRDGRHIYISGQVPRVDNTVVVTGSAGVEVSLAQAQLAAWGFGVEVVGVEFLHPGQHGAVLGVA